MAATAITTDVLLEYRNNLVKYNRDATKISEWKDRISQERNPALNTLATNPKDAGAIQALKDATRKEQKLIYKINAGVAMTVDYIESARPLIRSADEKAALHQMQTLDTLFAQLLRHMDSRNTRLVLQEECVADPSVDNVNLIRTLISKEEKEEETLATLFRSSQNEAVERYNEYREMAHSTTLAGFGAFVGSALSGMPLTTAADIVGVLGFVCLVLGSMFYIALDNRYKHQKQIRDEIAEEVARINQEEAMQRLLRIEAKKQMKQLPPSTRTSAPQ